MWNVTWTHALLIVGISGLAWALGKVLGAFLGQSIVNTIMHILKRQG